LVKKAKIGRKITLSEKKSNELGIREGRSEEVKGQLNKTERRPANQKEPKKAENGDERAWSKELAMINSREENRNVNSDEKARKYCTTNPKKTTKVQEHRRGRNLRSFDRRNRERKRRRKLMGERSEQSKRLPKYH